MNPQQVWQAALGELQLQMTRATFDTWVKQTSVAAYEDGLFVVNVRNGYTKDWLENRLKGTIMRTLSNIAGRSVGVRFAVQPKEQNMGLEAGPLLSVAPAPSELQRRLPRVNGRTQPEQVDPCILNAKYTFDNFIVGSHSRLAHAAAQSVAEKPAGAYNPLFLYGGVGLGKTHLLHAIGHECLRQGYLVLYVSSEQFTNELINAIRGQTTPQFREKYRQSDVLLIDDIQFIGGKESTQEEFFHTFNTLHAANKQVVLSSDRPPRAINTLEERLRSRFEGGLMADISAPDLETRIAILSAKAEAQSVPVPQAALDFIARKVQSNIRELEGSLNRVLMNSRIRHSPVTMDLVAEVLQDVVSRPEGMEPALILETVRAYYRLNREDLTGKRRSKEIAKARQLAMYLLRTELEMSLPQIGNYVGGRDHTTVMYACDKVKKLIEEDANLRRDYLAVREVLYNPEPVRVYG